MDIPPRLKANLTALADNEQRDKLRTVLELPDVMVDSAPGQASVARLFQMSPDYRSDRPPRHRQRIGLTDVGLPRAISTLRRVARPGQGHRDVQPEDDVDD